MPRFRLTAPKPRVVENDIERQCLDLMALRQYKAERLHSGSFRSPDGKRWIRAAKRGTPDYIAVHAVFPGFYLEVKRPGGALSAEQEARIVELGRWPLAVAAVDNVWALNKWLDNHEEKAKNLWLKKLSAS